LIFPHGKIMSLRRKSWNVLKEQIKPLSPQGTIISLGEELKLPWGANVFGILFDLNFCIWLLIKMFSTTKL
jgi:hypothetical protein